MADIPAVQVEPMSTAAATRDFYEARYARGYMDRWEADRAARITAELGRIELRAGARVLDFGCGSGALTGLLRKRWPDASVHGADISATAIDHARRRHAGSGLQFHVLDDDFVRTHAGWFDLVFSHHVLEHAFELDRTIDDLAAILAPDGRMLHALPCGNTGSLPDWLCRQRRGGIETEHGHRYYFEDRSHLRRLRSDELTSAFARRGIRLVDAGYCGHALGAVRLFTELPPVELLALVDPRPFPLARLPVVLPLLAGLVAVWLLRLPAQLLVRARRLWWQVTVYRTRRLFAPAALVLLALTLPALLLAPLSLPVEAAIRWGDRREWRRRRGDPRGAEMLLQFACSRGAGRVRIDQPAATASSPSRAGGEAVCSAPTAR